MLARQLASALSVPLVHVDSLEFNSDLSKKSLDTIRKDLKSALTGSEWILDGYGPLDMLPSHLKAADVIIFIDFRYCQNLLWLIKRQLIVLFKPRLELPAGAREWNWAHFKKMLVTLRKQHKLMNPELLRILQRPENHSKLVHVKTQNDLQYVPRLISG